MKKSRIMQRKKRILISLNPRTQDFSYESTTRPIKKEQFFSKSTFLNCPNSTTFVIFLWPSTQVLKNNVHSWLLFVASVHRAERAFRAEVDHPCYVTYLRGLYRTYITGLSVLHVEPHQIGAVGGIGCVTRRAWRFYVEQARCRTDDGEPPPLPTPPPSQSSCILCTHFITTPSMAALCTLM